MIVLNLSIFIEISSLAYPQHFLLIASFANVCKNITFLLGAASRASLNYRFAKRNNIGDLGGKTVS